MDYCLFWTLNPKRLEAFKKAYDQKHKYNLELGNFQAWLQGIYFAYSVGSIFSKKAEYPDKPIDFSGEDIEREQTPLSEEEIMAQRFQAMAIMFNHNLDKQRGD